MVPVSSCKVSRAPQYSGFCPAGSCFTYGALTLCGRPSHACSVTFPSPSGSPYPGMTRIPVWANPGSLAATSGITFVFFSSGYLDVSVRRVPLHNLLGFSPYSVMDAQGLPARVSPFRYLRITVYLPLPAAFRSLSRLSSAPSARASTLCLSLLNPLHHLCLA